jgi:hypothetical protein
MVSGVRPAKTAKTLWKLTGHNATLNGEVLTDPSKPDSADQALMTVGRITSKAEEFVGLLLVPGNGEAILVILPSVSSLSAALDAKPTPRMSVGSVIIGDSSPKSSGFCASASRKAFRRIASCAYVCQWLIRIVNSDAGVIVIIVLIIQNGIVLECHQGFLV